MQRHTRYLELRLAQCTPRPELHRHQLPALRELIGLSRSGLSPSEFKRRTGHLFALVQAEWLDRYDNLADLHAALEDDRMRQVAEISRSAGQARSFAELSAALSRVLAEATGPALAATTAVDTLGPLLVTLLDWETEAEPHTRAILAQTVKGLWREIQLCDPGCSWQRICSAPPYRNRLPFGDEGLALIGSWLHRAVGTQLVGVPAPVHHEPHPLPVIETPDDPFPSVRDVARGYHDAYDDALRRGDSSLLPIYERIFEIERLASCANDFLCRITAEDLICELSRAQLQDMASDALAHCAGRSQPLVEFHYESLVASLRRATSSTGIEHEIARHELCFAVESAWHQVFAAFVFQSISRAMAYDLEPSERRRQTLRRSAAVTQQLFGDWDAVFAIPRVWEFVASAFVDEGRDPDAPGPLGAYRGEVGLEVWAAIRLRAGRGPVWPGGPQRFPSPEQLRDHLTRVFRSAMAGGPPSERAPSATSRGVVLWGHDVSLDALAAVMSSPPRPC